MIAACIKWIGGRSVTGLSAADECAIEMALRHGEATRSSVIAVTVGSAVADRCLRDALACGAATAIRVDAPDNMDSASVDAQDVFAVRKGFAEAIERARHFKRPTLMEMRTTRFMGHSMSDAASGTYRSKEELESDMHTRDPIARLRKIMTSAKQLTDDEFTALDTEIKAEVQDAWDFADAAPEPSPEELFTHLLADTTSDDLPSAAARATAGAAR